MNTTETLVNDAPNHRAEITLRYSAWSASPETWKEYAPETFAMLSDGFEGGYFEETGETLTIVSRPHYRKSDIDLFTVVFTPEQDAVRVNVTVESETDEEYENIYEVYFRHVPYGTSLLSVLETIDEIEADVITWIEEN